MTAHRSIRSMFLSRAVCAAVALSLGVMPGCDSSTKKKKPSELIKPIYTTLPTKKVPPFLQGTILEKCDLINTEPFLVSGYGLVVNLDNTGDTIAPNMVREYIVTQMIKHKWGSSLLGVKMPTAEQSLKDPRLAIVEVDGYLPPGVRKGQPFDVQISALQDSNTSSLAQGQLLETDLRIFGANPNDPAGAVNVFGRAQGPVFVNPAYALQSGSSDSSVRRSLRMGVVMNGARSLEDRPIGLRLRQPSMRLSRFIEGRIDQQAQEIKPEVIANAQDEGIVNLFVPVNLNGDWEHFAGLVLHLYLNDSPEFAAAKARELADVAVTPDAPLMDISYCWEGLGKAALPVIRERELMTHPNPDVAYAAARAAAYLGDQTAPQALVKMARTSGNKFQVNAVSVLATLVSSPAINELIRPLLNSPDTLIRLEAYRMLANNGDGSIFSTPLKTGFTMDVVPSDGPPVIYATRRGQPRLGIIGNRTSLQLPITFSTLDGRLSISSDPTDKFVNIFYRPPMPPGGPRTPEQAEQLKPISVASRPDLAEVIARLSGEGFDDARPGRRLDFDYCEILSILTGMADAQKLTAVANGEKTPASFILQELPQTQDSIYSAPVIPDQARPQNDDERKVGMAK